MSFVPSSDSKVNTGTLLTSREIIHRSRWYEGNFLNELRTQIIELHFWYLLWKYYWISKKERKFTIVFIESRIFILRFLYYKQSSCYFGSNLSDKVFVWARFAFRNKRHCSPDKHRDVNFVCVRVPVNIYICMHTHTQFTFSFLPRITLLCLFVLSVLCIWGDKIELSYLPGSVLLHN